jgi:hypothetical protein
MRGLLLLLGILWLGWLLRRAWKALSAPLRRRPESPGTGPGRTGPYADLTDQEISDADYEEIP